MNSTLPLNGDFFGWCGIHMPPCDAESSALQAKEALRRLVESVELGQITSIDGVDSPLSVRIKQHHQRTQFEMNSHWIGSDQQWRCPCCSRSKLQISRIGQHGQILANLVIHHDHMHGALEEEFNAAFNAAGTDTAQIAGLQLVDRMSGAFAAYEEVLICPDCNDADTKAKAKVGAPRHFSFSISQIRQFIRSGNHQTHEVDEAIAGCVWLAAKPAYELRMDLIRQVAKAAATQSHWYEPYERGRVAIPVLGHSKNFLHRSIERWVSAPAIFDALGPAEASRPRILDRWRIKLPALGPIPPPNYLAMLLTNTNCARSWNSVPNDWQCPTCKRSKYHCVYVDEKGAVGFYAKTNSGRGLWAQASVFCNHCESILGRLAAEVSGLAGVHLREVHAVVVPGDLSSVIIPRPHSFHSIKANEAKALVDEIVRRLPRTDPNISSP